MEYPFDALEKFRVDNDVTSKGRLSAVLIYSDIAKRDGLPIDPDSIKTNKQGQIASLSGSRVRSILSEYGIHEMLASEGGRTTRGNLSLVAEYVSLLNQIHERGFTETGLIRDWWVNRVQDFFNEEPMRVRIDESLSVSARIARIIAAARQKESQAGGTKYVGQVLQHLVGAKLSIIYPDRSYDENAVSTADEQTGRPGDFFVGDTAIHVTAAPTEALIKKCSDNINRGLRPFIVTVKERVASASGLADDAGMGERVEVVSIEQFVATNVAEWSDFTTSGNMSEFRRLIETYNDIVDSVETDKRIKIRM